MASARTQCFSKPTWLLILATIVLCGCQGSVPLSERARLSVTTVRVSPKIKQPDVIQYYGPTFDEFAAFPDSAYAVPLIREAVLAYAMTPFGIWQVRRCIARLEKALTERADIDVGETVRKRFLNELKRAALFPEVVSDDDLDDAVDAELRIEVEFGIAPSDAGFAPGLKPWMELQGTLVDREGRILWRDDTEVSTFNKRTEAFEGPEYYFNPELVRNAVKRTAGIAVQNLVRDMSGG